MLDFPHSDTSLSGENRNYESAAQPNSAMPFGVFRANGVYRQRYETHVNRGAQHGPRFIMEGKLPTSEDLLFTSNDYLNLAQHPLLIGAQISALQRTGNGVMMSAVFVQDDNNPQRVLERQFARDLGYEDAILTQSGWCANTGLLQSIADETTPVYIDMYAHASLWEGILSARARAVPVQHNDVDNLRAQIKRHGAGIIAIDSVYSTSGSLAPLIDYVRVAREEGCVLVVDESHSLGTHGPNGEGLVASLGLNNDVDFVTASLAKAYAGRAGIVTCRAAFKQYLMSVSRPAVFSSTLLPHDIAGLAIAHAIIRSESWRRDSLHAASRTARKTLLAAGYPLTNGSEQILGFEVGAEVDAMHVRNKMDEHGLLGSLFIAPATPVKRALVRLTVNSGHSEAQIERLVSTLIRLYGELGVDNWSSSKRARRTHAVTKMVDWITTPARRPVSVPEALVA